MTRERSHKKGETYQQDAKHWLMRSGFLGLEATPFGDAYDVTKKACTLGKVVFDFSLKLGRAELTRHILYAECKYRDERRGNVSTEFKEFLKHVVDALTGAHHDDTGCAYFVFLSNVPPEGWRDFLRDRRRFCEENIVWETNPPRGALEELIRRVHVIVLSAEIIARTN